MKVLSYIVKAIEAIIRSAYFLAAVAIISISMYFFGGSSFLRGAWGTDTRSILAMLVWINKYFPKVPFWYPLAGGGVSLTHAYPVFSLYIISFLERITQLNVFESFSLLGFSSVGIMALSIYAFVSLRLKNQTAALIASIFYLISPITWTWLVDWGFYAESIAHLFLLPAILFWDFFFTDFIKGKFGFKTRLYLFLTTSFVILAMLNHFLAGFSLIRFFSFYLLGYTLLSKGKRKQVFLRGLVALLLVSILSYLLAYSFSTPFQRYRKIASEGGLSGGIPSLEDYRKSIPTSLHVLGFRSYEKKDFLWGMNRFSFPAIVSVLGFVGLFFFWSGKRMFTLAIFAAFSLFISLSPYYYFSQRYLPLSSLLSWFFTKGTAWRETFMITRAVWPILASLGIVKAVSLPLFWAKNKFLRIPKGLVVAAATLLIAGYCLYQWPNLPKEKSFLINWGASEFDLRNIWQVPKKACFPDEDPPSYEVCFGPDKDLCLEEYRCLGDEKCLKDLVEKFKKAEIDYRAWCHSPLVGYFPPLGVQNWCHQARIRKMDPLLPEICQVQNLTQEKVKSFWKNCQEEDYPDHSLCHLAYDPLLDQLTLDKWPKPELAKGYNPNPGLGRVLEKISQENPIARLDFSPYRSDESMMAPYYNLNRNLSQLHIYVASASLIHRFQGWQQIVYYLNDPQYDDPELINNIARWFGLNYIFTVPNQYTTDEVPIFERAGWEVFRGNYHHGILKFPEKNSLSDLANKTSALVIGQNKVSAYDQVLTISLLGVLPYQDAFLIWGKDRVDQYSLEELQKFKLIILQGYSYKNKGKTNQLLSQYVKDGGHLFIDTGWQYTVPDWETDSPLEIIPLKSLSWTDLGKTSDYSLQDNRFGKEVDLSKFAPLDYQGQSWNVSTFSSVGVKDWAKIALSVGDYPLVITGELGKGKIVWSGMNLFAHAKQSDKIYQDEIQFLANLFSWLKDQKESRSLRVSFTREHPDKIEFTINDPVPENSFLLWKEGYYSDFRARLIHEQSVSHLDIYRSGPGWALIRIPKAEQGDKIVYQYQKPFSETTAQAVSILTFILMIIFALEGLRGEKSFLTRKITKLEKGFSGSFSKVKVREKLFSWWEKDTENDY